MWFACNSLFDCNFTSGLWNHLWLSNVLHLCDFPFVIFSLSLVLFRFLCAMDTQIWLWFASCQFATNDLETHFSFNDSSCTTFSWLVVHCFIIEMINNLNVLSLELKRNHEQQPKKTKHKKKLNINEVHCIITLYVVGGCRKFQEIIQQQQHAHCTWLLLLC